MKNFLDRSSDCKSGTNNFKFYVSASQDVQVLSRGTEEVALQKPKPKLLDGEIIITEGNRVLYFPDVADRTKGLSGNLYVTNFRFIFDAYQGDSSNDVSMSKMNRVKELSMHQINHLIGDHSSCLTNIQNVYQLYGEKKKKLLQDSQLTEKIKGLQIVCKTMKVFTFNFDQSPIHQGRNIAKTLLHHAFPGRHQLLFAYDYSGKNFQAEKYMNGVVLFSKRGEWENELVRTCSVSASNWRISTQNQMFQMSTSLPQWLIVPHCLLDHDFVTASQSFRCNRPPIWTWSSPNGAALIRTADLLPTITDRTQENRMLENIRKCHPQLKGPCIKDLSKNLPSVSELFQCYAKLKELCIPDSHRQFKLQDSHLYSALENTKWLQHVSSCLKVAVEAAGEIQLGTTVVLQESDGRDTSALISSLVQLVLDPHTRTILGFQSLIQKEWIALGHPFCKRLGLLGTDNAEQSPVFLLFLDCVWQLQNQFPCSFQFTETYLTTLWDSVFVSVFDTFLFDCEKDRTDALMNPNGRLQSRSVWDWSMQFSDSDVDLFFNPLYTFYQFKDLSLGNGEGDGHDYEWSKGNCGILAQPEHSLPCLGLWMQCYFRWLPLLSIRCGGFPQIDLIHRQLVFDIQVLLNVIRENSKKKIGYGAVDSMNNENKFSDGNADNESDLKNRKKGESGCSKESSNNARRSIQLNKMAGKDHESVEFNFKDAAVLFKHKNAIDNFFPFSTCSTASISGASSNSSNLSEFDTPSLYNLTN